jgi:hypothetical protein
MHGLIFNAIFSGKYLSKSLILSLFRHELARMHCCISTFASLLVLFELEKVYESFWSARISISIKSIWEKWLHSMPKKIFEWGLYICGFMSVRWVEFQSRFWSIGLIEFRGKRFKIYCVHATRQAMSIASFDGEGEMLNFKKSLRYIIRITYMFSL